MRERNIKIIILSAFFVILIGVLNIFSFSACAQQITKNSAEKISFDIKGMDVVDVLKIISERSGMNIVVGKNVSGRVTLFLKNVDTLDALEIILASNELAYEKEGAIINVMTEKDYESKHGEKFKDKKEAKIIPIKFSKAADLARSLNQIKTNIGKVIVEEGTNSLVLIDSAETMKKMAEFISKTDLPVQTEVFSLNYAKVDKLSPKIQEAVTKGVGQVKIDERTNKIIVTDYPEKLAEISKIISAFDDKTPQVLIDAQIIQLTPSDQFQMGVNWDYWIKKYFEFRSSLPINLSNAMIIGTHDTSSSGAPTQAGKYQAVVDMLRTIGDTKILSSPRVMALNNQEAKILVGTKDAYITSNISQGGTGTTVTAQSVNFVDTGIQLGVLPVVSGDGFVTMKIRPQISDAEFQDLLSNGQKTTVPIVTTSEAETTVTVKDGVTIIIGGLTKDNRTKTVKKIPVLGDIPGLGFLFRSTDDKLTKTDLVILLTPHIITGETPFTDFSQMPPIEGAVSRMEGGQISVRKFSGSTQEQALNSLETVNSMESYNEHISKKIFNQAKLDSLAGKTGEVKLSFFLSQEGRLINDPEALNFTDPSLVPIALSAVKNASPFPSFPEGVKEIKKRFFITIVYK